MKVILVTMNKPIDDTRRLTPAQLRALGSPPTLEVFEAIQLHGPASAAELAPHLERKANTLHYHLRKLVKLKMVQAAGVRRSGARSETLYTVTAHHFEGDPAPKSKAHRQATVAAVHSLMRAASRDYESATSHPELCTQSGRYRDITAERCKGWLTRSALAEVNAHLDEIREIFARHSAAGPGVPCAMTFVVTPLRDGTSDPEKRS